MLKYHPSFPDRFGSFEQRRAHCADFFPWYNTVHRHSSLGWHTPHDFHEGLAAPRQAQRAGRARGCLRGAVRALRPPRPDPRDPGAAAWINPHPNFSARPRTYAQ